MKQGWFSDRCIVHKEVLALWDWLWATVQKVPKFASEGTAGGYLDNYGNRHMEVNAKFLLTFRNVRCLLLVLVCS